MTDGDRGTDRPPGTAPALALGLTLIALLLSGCGSAIKWTGIRLLYREAPEPTRVLRDVAYREGSRDPKHTLDFFTPAADGWPTLVFVHGGGWTRGDKGLVVAGADVYGNIGRFFASRGIATAVINYRLQPEVDWRDQADDVAHAVAWARSNAERNGGDPRALFLAGHSAGAQLAALTALAPDVLGAVDLDPGVLCGVIPISGLAFDLEDEETYRLGAKRTYYEERFRGDDPGEDWQREASPRTYVSAAAPPFLLLHGSWEWKALRHQNRLFHAALAAAGVDSELRVAKQRHATMVLALSSEKKLPARSVLEFVTASECAPAERRTRYQPPLPGSPLIGPTTLGVTQPP